MAANKVTAVHGLGFSRPRTTTSRMGENPTALFLEPIVILAMHNPHGGPSPLVTQGRSRRLPIAAFGIAMAGSRKRIVSGLAVDRTGSMSASGPFSDLEARNREFRFTPRADIVSLATQVRKMPQADNAGYSMILSARPSNEIGTVMPSVSAVFKFTISSTVVDCCTGRSAGLAPFRIRPA
jgi:hypothetical protein